jgi:small subunit ribosomal protein S9
MVTKTKNYYEGVGRRKTAVARVRIIPSKDVNVVVNDKNFADYFQTEELRNTVLDAHKASGLGQVFELSVHVEGSGIHAQAEAVRHGFARAILAYDANLRPQLKAAQVLKRDARAVERKKPGLKKARKGPTWSKR